jgi:hypothetical protein
MRRIDHQLEIGLTQTRETMALRNLTTIYYLQLIMCEDPTWTEIHWNNTWFQVRSHKTSHSTWGLVTTLHDFGGVLGQRPLGTFFWALTIPWSHSWLVCQMALRFVWGGRGWGGQFWYVEAGTWKFFLQLGPTHPGDRVQGKVCQICQVPVFISTTSATPLLLPLPASPN